MPSPITGLGKGAIRRPDDPTVFKFQDHPTFGAALAAVDWTKPFMNPEPENEDQNGSGSCVGQGWSYYHDQIKPTPVKKSRRDLYAPIHIPGGGAAILDGGNRLVNIGQATRDVVPDPSPEAEAAMEDMTGIPNPQEATNRELQVVSVQMDIDHWAAAIAAYKGIVGGVEGRDVDWEDIAVPNPPPPDTTSDLWGHCLYWFGYHTHEDGQKCVIAKSSWGTAGNTTVHHIRENYFASGYMFNAFILIPKQGDSMNLYNDNGTFFIVGTVGGVQKKAGIANLDFLQALQAVSDQVITASTEGISQVKVIKDAAAPGTFEISDN